MGRRVMVTSATSMVLGTSQILVTACRGVPVANARDSGSINLRRRKKISDRRVKREMGFLNAPVQRCVMIKSSRGDRNAQQYTPGSRHLLPQSELYRAAEH